MALITGKTGWLSDTDWGELRPDPFDANAELAGLVDDVFSDAISGCCDQSLEQCVKHFVIALKRSGFAVAFPVGLVGHLGDTARINQSGAVPTRPSDLGAVPNADHGADFALSGQGLIDFVIAQAISSIAVGIIGYLIGDSIVAAGVLLLGAVFALMQKLLKDK